MTQVIPTSVNLERIPSIYATRPSAQVSEKYGFIPTSVIVHALESAGFVPVRVQAARSQAERAAFAKHLIRFRHREHMHVQVGDWLPEVVLLNSHDGSSSYHITAGVFRLVCSNGLIVGTSYGEARVRHTKHAPEEIVDASFRVIEALPRISESVQSMQAMPLEPFEREAFATAALTLRYPEAAPIHPQKLLTTRRAADESSDLWTTLNVVQENVLRGGQRGVESNRRTRRISSVTEDVRINRGLWTLAEELKRLKSQTRMNWG
jgi:Domain of unknown function (DUF932)